MEYPRTPKESLLSVGLTILYLNFVVEGETGCNSDCACVKTLLNLCSDTLEISINRDLINLQEHVMMCNVSNVI